MTSSKGAICTRCVAEAGIASDRCEECKDFSAFERGAYSMKSLEGLTAQGKLAFILSALAALEYVIVEGADNED